MIKTNINAKIIILFLVMALLCIAGILACARENLPTNSTSEILNISDNNNVYNIVDTNTNSIKTNINTSLPMFDKNSYYTNIIPTATTTKSETTSAISFPADSYYDVHYFQGLNGGDYYREENVSYMDTDKLSEIWTNTIIKNFYIEGGTEIIAAESRKSKLMFKPNGDIYWEKKPDLILKKFEGGTIVMYRGGEFQYINRYTNRYTIGGVYTYAISRDEANKLGNSAVYKLFNLKPEYRNDNGGKKGRIDILVMNAGYFWNGGTGISGTTKLFPDNYEWLLLVEHNSKIRFAGFQAYSHRGDDRLSRYLYLDNTIVKPELNMRHLENTWNFYNGATVNLN